MAAADCDGPAATTLRPAAYAATDARAYWLDATTIRWPSKPAGAYYRLHAADDAGLRVERGAVVQGAGTSIALVPASDIAARSRTQFAFTGSGVELQLPMDARARIGA